jgi:hypothetical protein
MTLRAPTRDFVIRRPGGDARPAGTLVLGPALRVADHLPSGLPQLEGGSAAEAVLVPSGGDDTAAIQAALDAFPRVRLAPGTFTTTAPLALPAGTVLAGSGRARTTLQVNGPTAGVLLQGGDAGVESLSMVGRGPSFGYVRAISGMWDRFAVRPRRVHVRDVHAADFGEHTLVMIGVHEVELSDVLVERGPGAAIIVNGDGADVEHVTLRNVTVRQSGTLHLVEATGVDCTGVVVEDAAAEGLRVHMCHRVRLAACRVARCQDSYDIGYSTEVQVAACASLAAANRPLRIFAGAGVTVDGFLSDQSAQAVWNDVPHLLVGGGATQVLVPNFRHVDPFPAYTFHADVAGAGGRVVFIQNALAPAKVNGGANYVQL